MQERNKPAKSHPVTGTAIWHHTQRQRLPLEAIKFRSSSNRKPLLSVLLLVKATGFVCPKESIVSSNCGSGNCPNAVLPFANAALLLNKEYRRGKYSDLCNSKELQEDQERVESDQLIVSSLSMQQAWGHNPWCKQEALYPAGNTVPSASDGPAAEQTSWPRLLFHLTDTLHLWGQKSQRVYKKLSRTFFLGYGAARK